MLQKNLLPGVGSSCYKKSSARYGAFLPQKNLQPGAGLFCHKKSPTRRGAFLPQKNLLPGMGLSYHKKNLPLGAEPSCYRKIFRPARSLLATEKSSARRGAFLLQKNLPPGAEPSYYRKIFRPVRGLLATKKSPARTDGRFFFFSNSRQSASEPLITIRRSHISWPFPTSGWL